MLLLRNFSDSKCEKIEDSDVAGAVLQAVTNQCDAVCCCCGTIQFTIQFWVGRNVMRSEYCQSRIE